MWRYFFRLLMVMIPLIGNGASLTLPELASTQEPALLRAEIARLAHPDPQSQADPERLKRLGIAWHNLAILEVGGASAESEAWLRQASQAAPGDYEVMAYLGSALTMVARDSWNVVTKVSAANKGTVLIDKAQRLAPDNITIRMVRMTNSLNLPAFFGRAPKAREELVYLHRTLATQTLLPVTAAEICYRLGELMQGEGDTEQARQLFAEARGYAPDSGWGKRAQERLGER